MRSSSTLRAWQTAPPALRDLLYPLVYAEYSRLIGLTVRINGVHEGVFGMTETPSAYVTLDVPSENSPLTMQHTVPLAAIITVVKATYHV